MVNLRKQQLRLFLNGITGVSIFKDAFQTIFNALNRIRKQQSESYNITQKALELSISELMNWFFLLNQKTNSDLNLKCYANISHLRKHPS